MPAYSVSISDSCIEIDVMFANKPGPKDIARVFIDAVEDFQFEHPDQLRTFGLALGWHLRDSEVNAFEGHLEDPVGYFRLCLKAKLVGKVHYIQDGVCGGSRLEATIQTGPTP